MEVHLKEKEFIESLYDRDLEYLDSEYTHTTRMLVKSFEAYGAHLNKWWVMTSVNWACPCCNRTKSEIVRLNKNNYLTCQLHEHHDHMQNIVKSLFESFSTKQNTIVADRLSEKFAIKTAFSLSAYDNTVVCFDCNKADAEAKKIVNAHKFFSFSPSEIGEFVISQPNREHQIDRIKALTVWKKVEPVFKIRMEMAENFARIAAEKKDWYQPSDVTAKQIERTAQWAFARHGLTHYNDYEPEKLLYNTEPFKGSNCSWRLKPNPIIIKRPTSNEILHLSSTRGKYWDRYDLGWSCPCCKRDKLTCVRPSKKNPWVLEIKSGPLFLVHDSKVDYKPDPMCADCLNSAINLGREVTKEIGSEEELAHPSSVVSVSELSKLIISRPHSKHNHNNEFINLLIPTLIKRAKEIIKEEQAYFREIREQHRKALEHLEKFQAQKKIIINS